jgi:hypothetical protein
MEAAIAQVDRLTRANKVNRRVTRALALVTALVVIACAALAWVAVNQHSDDVQLHNAGVSSCTAGNTFRSEQTQIWNEFIGLLINKKTPPATLKIAHDFLAYVSRVDALRDCVKLYNTTGDGAGTAQKR